jgi:hypothetical protein
MICRCRNTVTRERNKPIKSIVNILVILGLVNSIKNKKSKAMMKPTASPIIL